MKNPFKNKKCKLTLSFDSDGIEYKMSWPKGDDNACVFADVVGHLITGNLNEELFTKINQYANSIGEEGHLDDMHDIIQQHIFEDMELKEEIKDEEGDEPLIQPINAMRAQITMYQQQDQQ